MASKSPEREAYDLDALKQRAKSWVSTEEGEKEMFDTLIQDMLVSYQIEVAEGQNIRPERTGPSNARQSRKQAKELAELVVELAREQAKRRRQK